MSNFITELEHIINDRKTQSTDQSYTARLFHGGLDRILKKIGEEAGEVIIAAKNHDHKELTNEAADLMFHLLVALQHEGVSFADVVAVLEQRHQKK